MQKSWSIGTILLFVALGMSMLAPVAQAADDIDSSPFIVDPNLRVAPDQYSGAFSYSYPITLPPGRLGVQPSLGLTYSSANTDPANLVGYGWGLSIPKIERLSKHGSDDLYGLHEFTSSLSGELEDVDLIDATHGEFGAKIDDGSFLIYTYNSDETWTVVDKSGTTFTFGATSDARVEDPNDSTRVYSWYLTEMRDTHDNTVTYTYEKDGEQVYPLNINYTGHDTTAGLFDVVFTREARADDFVSYATGFVVTTSERISQIDVTVGSNTVRSYALDYVTGDNGTRSLLASILESGTDTDDVTITKPPVTFDYSVASRTFTEDTNFAFPLAIGGTSSTSLAVYMFDVNGDALPDVVKSNDAGRAVYINNGDNTWTEDQNCTVPLSFVATSGGDRGVRVFDANGDGLLDLVSAITDSQGTLSQGVYLNDGDGTGWTLDSNYVVPVAFVEYMFHDRGVRVMDVDGDGMQDLVKAIYSGSSTREVYIHDGDGTGWTLDTGYTIPVDFIGTNTSDQGVRPVDVNGDGLVDLVQAVDNGNGNPRTVGVYVNQGDGTGWVQDTGYTVPASFIVNTNARRDNGVRLIDVNGDGFTDLYHARQLSTGGLSDALYVNNADGTGWTEDTSFASPSGFLGFATDGGADPGTREEDSDGSILTDLVYSHADGAGGWTDQLFVPDGERADLLTDIGLPAGASTEIVYDTVTLGNPELFFPLQVVSSAAIDDGLGNTSTATYQYENGDYYFADEYERKFAGFGKVTTTDGLGNVTIDFYHQGNGTDSSHGESTDDVSKIGKKYRQEIYDDADHLFKTSMTAWSNSDLGDDRDFVFANQTLDLTYDGDGDHVDTATDYTYDATTGNLSEQVFQGFVTGSDNGTYSDVGVDEITTSYAYATDTNGIIRNAVSSEQVEDHTSVEKLTAYTYDGLSFGSVSVGELTQQAAWISGTTYANTSYDYSAYGLVTDIVDAEDAATAYFYNSSQPLQPLSTTNDLYQETAYTYDLASGQVTRTTDPNGGISATTYDGFGRPVLVQQSQPGGGSTLDTVAEYVYDDDNVPNSVHETRYLDGSTSVNTYTYLDGLGRVIQIRKEAETSNHYSINDTSYDERGQVAAISLSYDGTGSARTAMTTTSDLLETYTYDALGRVTEVANAAGSTTSAYDQSVVAETDANGELKRYAYNARGLLVIVEENINSNAYNTTYQYSALGNLTKYTDAAGNVRNFTYDHLGRRLTAQDLHATSDTQFGTWSYTYDKVGDLLTTTDANGKIITNTYDALHRLLTENDPTVGGTDVTYTYDASCANGVGRLCSVTDVNGTTTAYTYDYLGRSATVAQTVDSTTRTTTNTYDRQGNQTVIQHPDGSKQEFTFGTAGRISAVGWRDSGNTLHSLVSSVTYAPHGAVDTITYANGVSTSYDYDETELYRLQNKTTVLGNTQFQDFTYTYDPSGNITNIVDAPTIYAEVDHAMTYDDLHRLTQAAATSTDANLSGTRNYTYSILGNIITSPIGTYLYQSTNANIFSNPHAVTKIGNTVVAYDKNGNMTSDGTFTNTWDFKNRLVTSAKTGNTITYRYDHTGNRVKKTDTTSGTPTYYVDSTYEIEGTKTRHHISAPGIGTIATVTTTSTTTDYAYHHTDHLGGTHVETDSSGNLLQYMVYEPFGKIRYNYKSGSYGNDRTFTGKELDSETSLQYFGARYYAPLAGRFTSADPIFLALGSGNLNGLRDPQAWNSYAYGRNNPYRMVDPDGQAFWDVVRTVARVERTIGNALTFGMLGNATSLAINAGAYIAHENASAESIAVAAGCVGIGTASATVGALVNTVLTPVRVVDAIAPASISTITRMESVRTLGRVGEASVGNIGAKQAIESLTGTATRRIPDGIINGVSLNEVKNVASQSLTNQLRDFMLYAEQKSLQFNLFVRENTVLSGPLQEAADAGRVVINRALP